MGGELKKARDSVVKSYKRDRNVVGILFFGSGARGKLDSYADLDFYVLLKRKGRYSRCSFLRDRRRIDILFDTTRDIANYFKEERGAVRRNVSHMLAYGTILYEKNSAANKLMARARRNLKLKTKYDEEEILMHKYSVGDYWGKSQRDIKAKNYAAFGIDSYSVISNILEMVFELNGAVLGQSNEAIILLKRFDKKLAACIDTFYGARSDEERLRALSNIVKRAGKKYGALPKRWSIKS